MGHRLLRNLSFASQPRPAAQERTEPRLVAAEPPLPFRRPASPDSGILSLARANARPSATAPIIAAPDRDPAAPGRQEPSPLRLAALAGCVLFVAAGVGSAAFLLFANPGQQPAGTAPPAIAAPPQTNQTNDTVSVRPTERHTAEPTPAPSPPSTLAQPAANDAALQSPSGLPLASPPSMQKLQPAATEVSAKPTSPSSPASATGLAERPVVAPTESPIDHRANTAPAATHRVVRTRPVERRVHPRVAREMRTSSTQSAPAHFATPQRAAGSRDVIGSGAPRPPDQAAAFNELLARLTGSAPPGSAPPAARPPKQVLTPPTPGAPDPFAARPKSGSPDQ